MRYQFRSSLFALAVMSAVPANSQTSAAPEVTMAESAEPNSNVTIAVEPALSDGRLIIKVAAQNRSTAPVRFGPGSMSITKAGGELVALVPLQRLVEEVNVAAGNLSGPATPGHASNSAYAAPSMPVNSEGRVDVSGYTGGMAVAPDETVRRAKRDRSRAEPAISREEADRQIGMLRAAILQDSTLQPQQIAAGQIVSEPLKFKKGEDRLLHLRLHIAGDEHSFTLAAPDK